MARSVLILLFFIGSQVSLAQLSEAEIQQGYNYYNTKKNVIAAQKRLSSSSLNPNEIKFACKWLHTDSIIKNFRSFYKPSKRIDTIFSQEQWENIGLKLRKLESIKLEKNRLPAEYTLRDSSYFKKSFPVLQESKDGSLYAFIYEEAEFFRSYGRLVIEKKVDNNWKIIGMVQIPLLDLQKLKKELTVLPEEYQVINSYLLNSDDYVLAEFVQISKNINNADNFGDLSTWEKMGESASRGSMNIKDHFEKEDLFKIVKYLKNDSSGNVESSFLLGNLETISEAGYSQDLKGRTIYSFSKPFVFTSNLSCNTYAIFYVSSSGGPLNEDATLVVMQKIDGLFKTLLTPIIWIG